MAMDELANDLFFVDAQQACRELNDFSDNKPGLTVSRLESTAAYLATLLPTLGLRAYAGWVDRFASELPNLEDGAGRRFARDLGEWLTECLARLESGESLDPARSTKHELYDRLRIRCEESGPWNASETSATPSLTEKPSTRQRPQHLFDEAVRTIEAVDALASLLLRTVKHPAPNHESLLPANRIDADSVHAASINGPSDMLSGTPKADLQYAAHIDGAHDVSLAMDDVSPAMELGPFPSDLPDESAVEASIVFDETPEAPIETTAPAGSEDALWRFELSLARDLRLRVDEAFRRALRLLPDQPWAEGTLSLLEAIDAFDHVPLRQILPESFQLTAGGHIRIDWDLALALVDCLSALHSEGSIDAKLVANTALLTVQSEMPISTSVLSALCSFRNGRFELDQSSRQCRVLLPASRRLLRITPMLVGDEWIAVSWSQILATESVPGEKSIEIRLRMGSHADRLIAKELGLLQIGVYFGLDVEFRRRDRFQGMVRLASGQFLPVYA